MLFAQRLRFLAGDRAVAVAIQTLENFLLPLALGMLEFGQGHLAVVVEVLAVEDGGTGFARPAIASLASTSAGLRQGNAGDGEG
jgi:hypothetical protein